MNRTTNNLPKTHSLRRCSGQGLDVACVGKSTPKSLKVKVRDSILVITAKGYGCRQMMPMDKYGFQPKNLPKDWRTGDIVCVVGKYQGFRSARIKTLRARGRFHVRVGQKVVSVSRRHI